MTARRCYPELTEAQLEAALEALTSRLAGETDVEIARRTYEAAEAALVAAQRGEVALFLSLKQARALQSLVGHAQGACEGEPDMIRIYRTPTAERASAALDAAITETVRR